MIENDFDDGPTQIEADIWFIGGSNDGRCETWRFYPDQKLIEVVDYPSVEIGPLKRCDPTQTIKKEMYQLHEHEYWQNGVTRARSHWIAVHESIELYQAFGMLLNSYRQKKATEMVA